MPSSRATNSSAPASANIRGQMARATGWTFFSFFIRRLVEAAVLLILGLLVAQEDFGRYNAWKAVFPPLLLLAAGGWDTILYRRRQNADTYLYVLTIWSAGATLLVALGLLIFGGYLASWYKEPGLAIWFRLGALWLAVRVGANLLRAQLTRFLEMGVVARWEIVRAALWGIGAVAVAIGSGDADTPNIERAGRLILAWMVADTVELLGLLMISGCGARFVAALKRVRGASLGTARARIALRCEWRFASILTLDQLMNALAVGLPVYLIGHFLGRREIALFAYGFQFVAIPLYGVLDTVNRVLLPGLATVDRVYRADRAAEVVRLLSVATMPILLWAFAAAPEFFIDIFGDDYYQAGLLTRCFILYLMLAPMTNISGAIEALTDHAGVGLTWNAVTLAGRLAILWYALPRLGLIPAILAFSIFSFLMWAFYQRLIARMLNVPLKRWLASWARFVPAWAAMLTFWLLWPEGSGDRSERLVFLLLGGFVGMIIYAGILGSFYRKTVSELFTVFRTAKAPRR